MLAVMRAEPWREPLDPEAIGRSTIGRAIRQFRLSNGWSQRQLGWMVGVNQSTIARLEGGTLSGMRLSNLARILGQLSLPPSALLVERGPPGPTRRLPGAATDVTAKSATAQQTQQP
jgi:transcriptional regulator with XRE-family HTH domain